MRRALHGGLHASRQMESDVAAAISILRPTYSCRACSMRAQSPRRAPSCQLFRVHAGTSQATSIEVTSAPVENSSYQRAKRVYHRLAHLWCDKTGTDPYHAKIDDVAEYVQEQRTRTAARGQRKRLAAVAGLKPATIYRRTSTLRGWFDYLIDRDVTGRNPFTRACNRYGKRTQGALLARPPSTPWVPNERQWQAIVHEFAEETRRNRLMFLLAYECALRRAELCALALDDVDHALRQVVIRSEKSKSRHDRWLPISVETDALLLTYAWTHDMAAEYVHYIMLSKVGNINDKRFGSRLAPSTQAARLSAIRSFFDVIIENEWIRRPFSPAQVFALPAKLKRQLGPKPRDLSDEVWTKLLWAGLNLVRDDFRETTLVAYPVEMLNALVVVWLLGGLRRDEIRRLRLDCIEWEVDLLASDGETAHPTICYLLVPANKYKPEFKKPVAAEVGKAIEAWLAGRPPQPYLEDHKTGQREQKLFAYRGRTMGVNIIQTIIRTVCEKAGVPTADSKGNITSHRARSTMATMLANAPHPMTPFELRDWLGHSSVNTTAFYVGQRPRKLAQKYMEADQWRRNIGRISVVIDREAISKGAHADGPPSQYYDVGLGYCGDGFFSRCAHRMACIKCSLFMPKESTKGQMLQAVAHNERLYEEVPIREDERRALEGDTDAIQKIFHEAEGTPAPDGTIRTTLPRAVGTTTDD